MRGNKSVYRLQGDIHAWNVDGSSDDKVDHSSWIRYWENSTGLKRATALDRPTTEATYGYAYTEFT